MSRIGVRVTLMNVQEDRILEIYKEKDRIVFSMHPIKENEECGYETFDANASEFVEALNKVIK